ncbi:glycosyltransferase involved in cell wall biosynthesis [Pasteurella langaaensis DSM 22999]|uniref:Glycosyltransferase involved in cell wall biosynthesis n=1 Tax=Alitibacter langaaensis DSM 22999 TaxID=1122935 RepID=A0A2U0SKI8_9PAST|nr:glycosyltransferase family 4 protein [Pasteurella langaaensis]PVX31865.1 glycosyltransferase involved in cell wall biosynthesis [Pasteurella langaaensis DSM 22999]
MKVAINTLNFRQGGGVERYILDLIKGFHDEQITPRIYTCKADATLAENRWIELIKTNLSLIPRKLRHRFLSSFVRQHRQADEVILSLFYLYCDIFICGGNHKGYLRSQNKTANLYERFIKIPFEQKVLNECKLVIAHSKLMKKELIELYQVPEQKIQVLYPPANTAKFNPISAEQRQALREKLGFNADEIIYLFPSTGHHRKGYALLKNYFNHADLPIRLVVAGTPVKESKNVVSLGFCKNMPELYQAADFTIMASSYEPFGLVGLESILSGTPVIFSENMACLEVLQNNFGFTFSRDDVASLASAVKNSINLVKAGKARIDNPHACLNYDPELTSHIEQLLQIMKNL